MGFSMAEESRKLFVAGLPDSMGEDVLRRLFEDTGGTVLEVSLPKDRATGRPRGFGFVTMSTSEQANAARQSLDGSFQAGRSISVRPFQAEPPRREMGQAGPPGGGYGGPPRAYGPPGGGGFGGPPQGMPGAPGGGGGFGGPPPGAGPGGGFGGPQGAPDRTLYVGNLPYDASVEEVEGLITVAGAGPVVRVHLPMDPDGRKRGFGFVTMGSAEAANAAIEALRGADVRGRRLVVNLAHPKGERPPGGDRPFTPGGPSGGPGGYAPPGGGGGGGGGGFAGGENRFGPPAPPGGRKGHDDRRKRNPEGDGPPGGGGAAGGGGRRQKNNWDRYAVDDDDD